MAAAYARFSPRRVIAVRYATLLRLYAGVAATLFRRAEARDDMICACHTSLPPCHADARHYADDHADCCHY